MPLDFPANPVSGQTYEGFVFDGTTWRGSASSVFSSYSTLSARVSDLESRVPAGTIHQYAGSTAPDGYLLCQGQAISRSTYAKLFSILGTTYGTGDGSTTFNLPDLRGDVQVGKADSGTFSSLNAQGGAEVVTLNSTQMPVHTHIQNQHTHTQNPHSHRTRRGYGYASGSNWGATDNENTGVAYGNTFTNYATATNNPETAVNQNTGGGQPHNNLQPYLALNFIIKT